MKTDIKKLTLTALFAAAALIIFIIEAQIPVSFTVPGIKLGLANIITLLILFLGGKLKLRDIFIVLIIRILLAAFITGQPMTLLYSLAGGVLALLIMALVKKMRLAVPVVSVAGAIAHNIGQITIAAVVLQSTSIFIYLPVLIAGGIISGLLTGIAVHFLFKLHPKFIGFLGGTNDL